MADPHRPLTIPTLDPTVAGPGDTLRPTLTELLDDVVPLPSPPMQPADALVLGDTLGEGAMAIVRSAVQGGLARTVAVKTLRKEHDSPSGRRRVLQEGWVIGALEHPNVVPVYTVGQDAEGRPYLVLRRIDGEPWSALLRTPGRVAERFGATDPTDWHLRVLLQVCNGVGFAHARGVLHRDLKPDNVMIGRYGEVYVLDWGIAVGLPGCVVPGLPRAEDQRGVAGTPAYLAPEQLGHGPLTARTDVYLLGGLLYEVLHGVPPHRSPGLSGEEGVVAVLHAVRAGVEPPVDPALTADLRQILAQSLVREPESRFPSVELFRAALQQAVDRRGVMQILKRAEEDLVVLQTAIASSAEVGVILSRLGACRFAFARVLDAIPEHPPARSGLDRALQATARWHLARGEWGAAELLVAEARSVSDELLQQVQGQRTEALTQRERVRELDDRSTGVRTRAFVTLVSGVVWACGPILGFVSEASGNPATYPTMFAVAAGFTAFGFALMVWARDSLSRSDLNRKIRWLLVAPPLFQLLAVTGAWLSGLTPHEAHIVPIVPWAALAFAYGILLERTFLVVALIYSAGYLVSAAWPALTLPVVAVANLATIANLLRLAWPWLKAGPRAAP